MENLERLCKDFLASKLENEKAEIYVRFLEWAQCEFEEEMIGQEDDIDEDISDDDEFIIRPSKVKQESKKVEPEQKVHWKKH